MEVPDSGSTECNSRRGVKGVVGGGGVVVVVAVVVEVVVVVVE